MINFRRKHNNHSLKNQNKNVFITLKMHLQKIIPNKIENLIDQRLLFISEQIPELADQ